MIISHKHKFIFIKTCKTAGTSVEIALSKFCGSEDIITRFECEDEEIRRKMGYRGAQNLIIPKSRYRLNDWLLFLKRWFLQKKKRHKFRNHDSAKNIKRYIGKKKWDSYFKFCVERNPWDRMISRYYWDHQTEPRPSISEFLKTKNALRLQREGIDLYTINGKIVVDKVCFYETLEEDLEKIRIRCGIPEKLTLPKAKSGFRKDHRNYRNILTNEEAEKIKCFSRREIELFGYQF